MELNTDVFEILWKEKSYTCRKLEMGESEVFVVEFTQRPFHLCKAVDSKGEPFWVTIPNDTKLSHVVLELGQQIDAHYAAPIQQSAK